MNISEKRDLIKEQIMELSRTANNIAGLWSEIQGSGSEDLFLVDDFPFDRSFDEMAAEISQWNDTVQSKKFTYKIGLREIWEQMYEVEASSEEDAEEMVRAGEGLVDNQFELIEIDPDSPYTHYEENSNGIGFMTGRRK